MGQSAVTRDTQEFQGTAAATGGTFAANFPLTTPDQITRLRATCIVSRASASHLADGACLVAEYVVENKNGTLSAPAAISGSNNPANSSTTTFVASAAQASDYNALGVVSLAWSIVGGNAVATYTNVGNSNAVNVTIVIEAISVGST